MKTLHITLATMFIAFTVVQFNDPDPLLWILIYASMAAICILAVFNLYYPKVMMVQGALFLVYCIILWSGVSQWFASEDKAMLFDDIAKMQNLYIEESREFLGLTICLIVVVVYIRLAFRSKRAQ